MSDTPKLLALMAKSRDVNALDYSKQLEVLVRELERKNAALLKDKQRLDFLESVTGSLWVSLHLGERKWLGELERLTRKEIDRRMATEPKP